MKWDALSRNPSIYSTPSFQDAATYPLRSFQTSGRTITSTMEISCGGFRENPIRVLCPFANRRPHSRSATFRPPDVPLHRLWKPHVGGFVKSGMCTLSLSNRRQHTPSAAFRPPDVRLHRLWNSHVGVFVKNPTVYFFPLPTGGHTPARRPLDPQTC
jgi:hypothetical protein